MSRPGTIDNLEFARRGLVREGELAGSDLDRAADLVDGASVRYRLGGGLGPRGEPRLTLRLDGVLGLYCQRCLSLLEWPLDCEVHFELRAANVAGDVPITPDDMAEDAPDVLPISEAMSVMELVEDELIMAIPIAPMHASCDPPDAHAGETPAVPARQSAAKVK